MNRTIEHVLEGHLTNSERAWMVGLGAGLVLFGLTRNFPIACVLGTIGTALAVEGITNANVKDVTRRVGEKAQ